MDLAETFWRDGYAVRRNMFSPSEVVRWRLAALDRGGVAADLLSDDILGEIVLDPRLIEMAREILDADPIYFGDSTATIGDAGTGFHKDNSDRYDARSPDWQVDRYPTIRFGIYTQSHSPGRPLGLDLRRGSHRHPDITSGKWVTPTISPGDVLVWNGRTTHSANSQILRGLNRRVKPNGWLWRILVRTPSKALLARHPQKRVALFVTYGREHPLLDRHIAYLKTRTYAVEKWRGSSWPEASRRLAAERGLVLLEPELDDVVATHDEYRQLAYQ